MARVEIAEVVLDQNGNALSGRSVQVNTRAGAAATVYAEATGSTTLDNPLTTSSTGQITGWVEEGSYNLVVEGVTTYYEAVSGDTVKGLGDTVKGLIGWGPAPPLSAGGSVPARLAESTGNTYYVNTATGNDSYNTTQAQSPSTPWQTIDHALGTVPDPTTITGGITIEVAAGTYTEQITATPADGDATHVLTLEGADPDNPPVIQHIANNPSAITINSSYFRMRNFIVNGTTQTTAGGDGSALVNVYYASTKTHMEFDNVTARNMTPRANVDSAQRVQAFYVGADTSYVNFFNCTAHTIDASGVGTAGNSHGFYVGGANSYRVNCVAYDIGNGFGFHSYTGSATSEDSTGDIHCTAAYCSKSGFIIDGNFENYVARNCISAFNDEYGFHFPDYYGSATTQTVQYCLTHSNTLGASYVAGTSSAALSSNATGDPDFTSASDLHISNASAARGVGTASYLTGSDRDGDSWRSLDAGAYASVGDTYALYAVDSFIELSEIGDPAAPASNLGRLYVKDNGGGKTQLCVRFPTGAVQVIATEP